MKPEEADYVVFSSLGTNTFEYLKYSGVRIFESYENVIPNFNFADYAISSIPIAYSDRSYYLPYCLRSQHFPLLNDKKRIYSVEDIRAKSYFASFIAGHESEYSIRDNFFKDLSQYKRVESPGTYLNNMPENFVVDWNNDSKTNFQRQCKFNLCFESTRLDGFITEKIVDAFFADGIPVYFGSDAVKEIFNPKAFIHFPDYADVESCIRRIIELDNDDEAYLEMLSQPVLCHGTYYEEKMQGLEQFIIDILERPIDKAFRRPRYLQPKFDEEYILRRMDGRNVLNEVSTKNLGRELLKRVRSYIKL